MPQLMPASPELSALSVKASSAWIAFKRATNLVLFHRSMQGMIEIFAVAVVRWVLPRERLEEPKDVTKKKKVKHNRDGNPREWQGSTGAKTKHGYELKKTTLFIDM
ncbi:hypothetical protein RB195_019124 [Necator americanus]|uniref:Uncharacterized protein n=1 Tax=Necator americanus TaxID=51031 RepID=A0ABR1CER0_NECAM